MTPILIAIASDTEIAREESPFHHFNLAHCRRPFFDLVIHPEMRPFDLAELKSEAIPVRGVTCSHAPALSWA